MEFHQRMKLAYERRQKIVRLRSQGKTYEAIGKIFDVTRERVRQILKKEEARGK